ncbi:MAG: rRNA pseudouridine synthase, partial [Selenomonas sp.]|nr:rRNA pseudouridine synthase [Selenomonas sp.]
MAERLQKIIAQAGLASRRAAESMILAGRVTVDGQTITELGGKYDSSRHKICVDGKPLNFVEKKVYYLLNKPKGYLSTAKDERGRRTVLDLLPEVSERVYPLGRLDNNTEGLLLISNDGDLMNGLLHPRYKVNKTYVARVA